MSSLPLAIAAAVLEITGCYAVWMWLRLDRPALWLIPGALALAGFAVLLTRLDASLAGRAYAAYGGVYILCSLLWMWAVERSTPDRWDLIGAAVCLLGAGLILLAPRTAT